MTNEIELVLFEKAPVTVLTVDGAGKFLARLLAGDVKKIPEGGVVRSVMMNATGGIIGVPWVARTGNTSYELILAADNADAEQAWVRQVSVAFDAEVGCESLAGFYFVGKLPVAEIALKPQTMVKASGLRFIDMGWMSLATGPKEAIDALYGNLLAAGAKKGEQTGFDALRIFAREPAMGLELDEGASPLETGLEEALDFSDPERIFIGRALTEARAASGKHLRMQLVAFDVAFDPSLLIEVPSVVIDDVDYPLTSIARVPEGPFTVGLVRLPLSVKIGDRVKTVVRTDPRVVCNGALVVDRQI